jgi:hypothetical protein
MMFHETVNNEVKSRLQEILRFAQDDRSLLVTKGKELGGLICKRKKI